MKQQNQDEELMAAYAQGRQEAFNELFDSYKGRIFAFLARHFPGKGGIVEDLFQLTWLKVHQSRMSFDPTKKFSTWIFTIAHHTMLDHFKRASTKYESAFEDFELSSNEDQASPEDQLLGLEEKRLIDSALTKIPAGMRDSIVLCEIEGLSSKEAAVVLGKSDNAVRQNLFKGRKLLRSAIEEILKEKS